MLLFRPTGLKELERVGQAQWRAWPPRLAGQPFFYPVLTRDYARKIARDWNATDEKSAALGFVTEFEVEDAFVSRYPIQNGAGRAHQELWVPAEELEAFNQHIIGQIWVADVYTGPGFQGVIDPGAKLPRDFPFPPAQ